MVDAGAEGFTHGKPEDKHGIRLSNTAALFLDDVHVDADRLVGGVEGQGLVQAQQVFGYTRLMVAAFGLGAGWAALDRAIAYSRKRIQAGGPLSEKQGYTHKLIVPHAVALEAARAAIEETAERIDAGEGSLNIEGAIAKYLASEAGNAAADAAIQAHGGYGYTHEYMVEKIKRDVRITTDLRGHLRDHGDDDRARALAGAPQDRRRLLPRAGRELEALHAEHPDVGADVAALALHALAELLERCRVGAADPAPARPAAPRRADRLGRGRRGVRPPRAPRPPKQLHPKAARRLARQAAGRRQPRVRPRRRADVATEARPLGGGSRRRRARRARAAPRPRGDPPPPRRAARRPAGGRRRASTRRKRR